MFLYKSVLPVEGDGMEIKVEGLAPFQPDSPRRIKPEAHQFRIAGRIDSAAIFGQKRALGGPVESGKQGQALIKDLAHDMAVAGIAEELESEERPDGMRRRDHLRAWKTSLVKYFVQTDLDEVGHKEKEATELGFKLPGSEIKITYICHGGGFRPYAGRPFLIAPPWQAGKSFLLENHGHSRRAQSMLLIAQDLADIVDGEVLLAQGNDFVPKSIRFGSTLRSFGGRGEEVLMGVLSKLMTKDPEASLRVPEASSRLGRGEAFDEIGPERLVLPVSGIGGFEEDPGEVC